jgi:hypothetical protein
VLLQLFDMANRLGPALHVGEGLVWKPPAPDAASKAPQTSVDVAKQMEGEIRRSGGGGAAYITQSASNDNNNNENAENVAPSQPAAQQPESERMGLDRRDFEELEKELGGDSSSSSFPSSLPPLPADDELYATPMKRTDPPPINLSLLRGRIGGASRGGLPSLASLPPLPTEDPNDDSEGEIEEEIEVQSRRRPTPAS